MTLTVDESQPPSGAFGHRLAPAGDPLEGAPFDALYQAKIEPELIKREAERKGAVRIFFVALAGGAVAVFLENLLAPTMTGKPGATVSLGIAIGTLMIAAMLGYWPLATVGRNAKVAVICALCEPLGIRYSRVGADPPSFQSFLGLHLLPSFTSKSFSDFFSGRRGGTDFSICEARLHRGSGKERTLVFQGQLLQLRSPRRRNSTTVVLRNTGFKNFECPSGLRAVGLEDPVFNKTFDVFSSDQVESREILTPVFMQHLVDLETAYSAAHIRCAFDQAELLIALEGLNRFGIGGLFSTLVDRSRVEGIARNIEQVFKMIDEFSGA